MSSIQALKDKRDSRQREYNVAATRLEKLREQKGFETDVSERFKLDNQIQQVEADLERLGHEIDSLDEKIQAVESGQIKVDEVQNLVWRSPQGSNDFFPAVVTLFKVP